MVKPILGLDLDLGLLITSDLLLGWCWCCYNLPNLSWNQAERSI